MTIVAPMHKGIVLDDSRNRCSAVPLGGIGGWGCPSGHDTGKGRGATHGSQSRRNARWKRHPLGIS
jgi:hypothetical protein